MLTTTQARYIDWYFLHRGGGKTIAQIAADAGVDTRTVDYGLAWCRKHNVGTRQDKAELEKRIADVQNDIKQIEQDIRRVRREIKKRDPTAAGDGPYLGLNNSLIGFRRELREHKKDLAELEGLLKRVLELSPPGGDSSFRFIVEFAKPDRGADADG